MEEEQREATVRNLEIINAQLSKQMSFWWMIYSGVLYGIGWFIGSAVVATIVFGLLAPIVGRIGWIHDAFFQGTALLRR